MKKIFGLLLICVLVVLSSISFADTSVDINILGVPEIIELTYDDTGVTFKLENTILAKRMYQESSKSIKIEVQCMGYEDSDWTTCNLKTTDITRTVKPTFKDIRYGKPFFMRVRYVGKDWKGMWSRTEIISVKGYITSDWAVKEVEKAAEMGLVPEDFVGEDLRYYSSRGTFARIILKVCEHMFNYNIEVPQENPFTDVDNEEVLKVYSLGIINGLTEDTFGPRALLTREQAATLLARVYKKREFPRWSIAEDSHYKDAFTSRFEMPALFADDKDISDYARDSVYFLAANNVLLGMGNNCIAPKNVTQKQINDKYANLTIEQAIVMAVRFVEAVEK